MGIRFSVLALTVMSLQVVISEN